MRRIFCPWYAFFGRGNAASDGSQVAQLGMRGMYTGRSEDDSRDGGIQRVRFLGGVIMAVMLATIVVGVPTYALAQPVVQRHSLGALHLTLSVDRQSMAFADQLHLTLVVEAPPDMVVVWPRVQNVIGALKIRRQLPSGPRPTPAHTQQWQQEYVLEAENAGTFTIPPLAVAVQAADTAGTVPPQLLTTESFLVTVKALLPADADVQAPKDIAPPVLLMLPETFPRLWGVVAGLVCLGCCAAVAWWYRHWRRTSPTAPQPAHVLALQALDRLRTQQLSSQQQVDAFYVGLSDIVRHYVGWRFGLHALEQTSEEFLATVRLTGGVLTSHQVLLSTFLQHCDLAKFARYWPAPDAIRQDIERATAFITQTADAQVAVPAAAMDKGSAPAMQHYAVPGAH
jgi:hypothetical protein